MKSRSNGYIEKMQSLTDRYFDETRKETATTRELSTWAIKNGLWEPPPDLAVKKCKEDFAKAMREQHFEDDRGRPVRAKHAARVRIGDEQLHLWSDIRYAPHGHMRLAFQQRREQIVGECRQLKRDVDYYNDNTVSQLDIQLVFDFTEDVAEGEFAKFELA